jgi:hypothetical protein
MMLRLVSVITLVSLTHAQLGPGNGAWETATPESEGLDSKALDAAEEKVRHVLSTNVFNFFQQPHHLIPRRATSHSRSQFFGWFISSLQITRGNVATHQKIGRVYVRSL